MFKVPSRFTIQSDRTGAYHSGLHRCDAAEFSVSGVGRARRLHGEAPARGMRPSLVGWAGRMVARARSRRTPPVAGSGKRAEADPPCEPRSAVGSRPACLLGPFALRCPATAERPEFRVRAGRIPGRGVVLDDRRSDPHGGEAWRHRLRHRHPLEESPCEVRPRKSKHRAVQRPRQPSSPPRRRPACRVDRSVPVAPTPWWLRVPDRGVPTTPDIGTPRTGVAKGSFGRLPVDCSDVSVPARSLRTVAST